MKEWVEAQARTGRYANASDYVRDLIRRDQEEATRSPPCSVLSMRAWRATSVRVRRTSYSLLLCLGLKPLLVLEGGGIPPH